MTEYDHIDAELYDRYARGLPGELEFYIEEACRAGGPVLELGCGTGRILLAAAEAGAEVVGIDRSPAMLEVLRSKLAALPDEARKRVEALEADMRSLDLGRRFARVFIPYRAFLHLLNDGEQRLALQCIHRHLAPDGQLIFNVFDPDLEIIAAHRGELGGAMKRAAEFAHPRSGNRVILWDTRHYQLEQQILDQYFIFEELDREGHSQQRTFSRLILRYVHRFEMQHLLELCGFEVVALFGDFRRGPFHAGGEQVWVAKPRA
jgi:SAM-dependent methyltransferase